MFKVYCPRHGSDVLLGYGRVRQVINVRPGVIVVELRCYDGEIVRLLTGSRADTVAPVTEPVAG
ncbi:MAG: hypothetical protein GEU86_22685 [Actinophytocola sp.]|nr:hypothetical protein [Actinophytocola sp.]